MSAAIPGAGSDGMLTFNQLAVLVCVHASVVAMLAWRRHCMLSCVSCGVLAVAAGIVLYLPKGLASHSPPGWGPWLDSFAVPAEFQVLGDLLEVAYLGLAFTIMLLVIERMIEWKKAGTTGKGHDDPNRKSPDA